MQWEFKTFAAKAQQPGREEQTQFGILRFAPKPPLPKRDSYLAVSDIQDPDGLITCMTEYWLKVAEVFPRYYAGKRGGDPLADQAPPEMIALDNGWDRIVCLIDVANGKFTTNLWKGSQHPRHLDRVWVIAQFSMIERALEDDDWLSIMSSALADAAEREPARTALLELQRWRSFELWVMAEHEEETLRPLRDAARERAG
jgi:hypothetical protein